MFQIFTLCLSKRLWESSWRRDQSPDGAGMHCLLEPCVDHFVMVRRRLKPISWELHTLLEVASHLLNHLSIEGVNFSVSSFQRRKQIGRHEDFFTESTPYTSSNNRLSKPGAITEKGRSGAKSPRLTIFLSLMAQQIASPPPFSGRKLTSIDDLNAIEVKRTGKAMAANRLIMVEDHVCCLVYIVTSKVVETRQY